MSQSLSEGGGRGPEVYSLLSMQDLEDEGCLEPERVHLF